MNRVYNWSIIAILFALISIGLMTFTNHPATAWIFMVPALVGFAMAAIRYDDHYKATALIA